jgi:aconitate decarboxylase
MTMDAINKFARHVATTRSEDIPETAIAAAEALILDTIGVGIGGSNGPMARELAEVQDQFGSSADAHVWSLGMTLPAAAAALCNAYQIHNSEFDCVHEAAVAHVLSAVVPAALAYSEQVGGIDGRRFIDAVVLGVDVAANLGVAATSGLRFFRPATVGAFGATAALGRLMGFDADQQRHAFSICYGQLCGTMQAHEEGSMLLAMQMGFNARNAVVAAALAAAGFTGPAGVLEGRFGYFNLIESNGIPADAAATLGTIWRITEVAHKPFPSGRATHGIIDGCLELQTTHRISPSDIASIEAVVPPLVHQLVGRPTRPDMDVNYARLCAAYAAARALLSSTLATTDFNARAYADSATQTLARKVSIAVDPRLGPNALTPVDLTITLADGTSHATHLDAVYGSPAKPMTRSAQLAKFRANIDAAAMPPAAEQTERLIGRLENLRELDDVATLIADMIGHKR